jgi:hypothetical protein
MHNVWVKIRVEINADVDPVMPRRAIALLGLLQLMKNREDGTGLA